MLKGSTYGKNPDAGKNWGQEKGATEGEMVGWHHWLNGHESEQTPGDSEGPGSLVCYSSWDWKESNTTEWQEQQRYYNERIMRPKVYWMLHLLLSWTSLVLIDLEETTVSSPEERSQFHSSVFAWRIPGKGEPSGLPSMEWHSLKWHDWSDLAAAAAAASMKTRNPSY